MSSYTRGGGGGGGGLWRKTTFVHDVKSCFDYIVQLLMSSRSFSLLIRVLYTKVFILSSRKWSLRIFSKSFEGQGQLNEYGRCMYIVTILVLMTMRCRSYNLILEICLP